MPFKVISAAPSVLDTFLGLVLAFGHNLHRLAAGVGENFDKLFQISLHAMLIAKLESRWMGKMLENIGHENFEHLHQWFAPATVVEMSPVSSITLTPNGNPAILGSAGTFLVDVLQADLLHLHHMMLVAVRLDASK